MVMSRSGESRSISTSALPTGVQGSGNSLQSDLDEPHAPTLSLRDCLKTFAASTEILRTSAFVANVQSTQRRTSTRTSHGSNALSLRETLRERVGVRGCCHR